MANRDSNKNFILDTNVILHESSCTNHFGEHDIVVTIIVLEGLDQFKKGNQTINFHAREIVRSLDNLGTNKLFSGGVLMGSGRGRISIRIKQELHADLKQHLSAVSKLL